MKNQEGCIFVLFKGFQKVAENSDYETIKSLIRDPGVYNICKTAKQLSRIVVLQR